MTWFARGFALARRLVSMPEFWSAFGLIAWGKWVLFEPVSLGQREPYHVLTAVIPTMCLEVAAIGIGAFQLAAVIYRRRWPRIATGVVATSFWWTLSHGLWLGEHSAPGAVGYFVVGAQDFSMMMLLCCPRRFGPA